MAIKTTNHNPHIQFNLAKDQLIDEIRTIVHKLDIVEQKIKITNKIFFLVLHESILTTTSRPYNNFFNE